MAGRIGAATSARVAAHAAATSLVELDRRALAKSTPIVEAFARVEGLAAHGRSARIRLE